MASEPRAVRAWAVERRWKFFASDGWSEWELMHWPIALRRSDARAEYVKEFDDGDFRGKNKRARLVRVVITREEK